jgi:hypothetical protein
MPPKKKARVSQASTPLREMQPKTPIESSVIAEKSADREPANLTADDDILNDPWTDEQATALYKGVIHYKPTGPYTLRRPASSFPPAHCDCH